MLKLWKKDLILAIGAGAVIAIAAAAISPLVGRFGFIASVGIGATVISAVVLEVYRRLQAQLKEAARALDTSMKATYHQIEALQSVVRTIEPTFPMPSTRTWAASPDILNHLCRLVLTLGPGQVFEVGSGVSTLTIAYCLRRNGKGRVVSLENDPAFAAATRQMLADHGVSHLATVVDAPLKEIELEGQRWRWYDVSQIPETAPIDLLFVDGPHGMTQPLARYPALPVLLPRLRAESVVVLDDGARPDERTIAERWSASFGMRAEYLYMEKGAYVLKRTEPFESPQLSRSQN